METGRRDEIVIQHGTKVFAAPRSAEKCVQIDVANPPDNIGKRFSAKDFASEKGNTQEG
jgi:hypothetical protein